MDLFTSVRLLDDIRRHNAMPEGQTRYDDATLCAFLTDAQRMRIVPDLLKTRSEYFVVRKTFQVADLEVLDADHYQLQIPARAIADRIRMLEVLDADGKVVSKLPMIMPETSETPTNNRFGFIFEGNYMIIPKDALDSDNQLRLKMFRRPSDIVDLTRVGTVTAVAGNDITLDQTPDGLETGTSIDITRSAEPFKIVASDISVLNTVTFTITVDAATAAATEVGDYVTFAGETFVPQIPVDLYPILVQFSIALILKSLGDREGAGAVMAELGVLQDQLFEMASGRDESSPKKVIAPGGIWRYNVRRRW